MARIKEIFGFWTQPSGVRITEIEYDYDAHAFEISYKGLRIVTIYAQSPEGTLAIRTRLDAGDDVRGWEDGNGNCVGTLIAEMMDDLIIKEI